MDEGTRQQLRELGIDDEVDDQGTFESNESRRAAISTVLYVIVGPAVVSFVLWVIVIGPALSGAAAGAALMGLACGAITIGTTTVAVGVTFGWFSHKVCWGSSIPVNRMALVLGLIFDAVILGWTAAMVLTFESSLR